MSENTKIQAGQLKNGSRVIDRDGFVLRVSDMSATGRMVSFVATYEEAAMMCSKPEPTRFTLNRKALVRVA